MKVAVTGGSGQLGTLVLRRLLDDPEVERVFDLDMRPPAVAGDKLKYMEADVRDGDLIQDLLEGCDALIHLAFIVTPNLPQEVFEAINVAGSEHVFRAAAAVGIRRIVYCSSLAAYGAVPGHPRPIVEDTPRIPQPEFPYADAKQRVEAFLDELEAERPELRIARLRPSILLGVRQTSVLARLLAGCLDLGWLPAAWSVPVPLVWDEDLADAVVLALRRQAHGPFNVSADDPLPPGELAAAAGLRLLPLPQGVLALAAHLSPLLARLGLGEPVDPAWQRQAEVVMVPSSERARTELGWRPRCPTAADVVRRYLEAVRGVAQPESPGRRLLDRGSVV